MNNVENKIRDHKRLSLVEYKGSIWKDGWGDLHIFADYTNDNYCLISLKNGHIWKQPSNDINYIVEGCTLVTMEATITITEA